MNECEASGLNDKVPMVFQIPRSLSGMLRNCVVVDRGIDYAVVICELCNSYLIVND
ncbi:MAG: hypothetical protein QW706_09440 [Candidatus Nezhaarchaeales archaeon]